MIATNAAGNRDRWTERWGEDPTVATARWSKTTTLPGDGAVAGARAALDRLLSDDEVDLLIADSIMGFMTFLGIISLSGIVINNAIVLLDRIKLEIEDNGLESARGVEAAAQRRLRPIVLTICTTVGGMLPLGLVPVLYALFFRVKFKEFTY